MMTPLEPLLAQYDRDETTRIWAEQNKITLDQAKFLVAIALGESFGDVVILDKGKAKPLPGGEL